ncbi:hypothetical protein [Komagataeibacter europaeus]|uniref:hypothetical protein n=1 Tax=Komagataeibacter europaeus TaxID=33995 RepID=UPI000237DEB4|nr:hypothetical protein [Komagataeibacter europaeus]
MTTPWNGLPDQPERSGWHWVSFKKRPSSWFLRKWISEWQIWESPFGRDAESAARDWIYGGPVLNPSELAQMRKDELRKGYALGFNMSGEGYNGEYPFQDNGRDPEKDSAWIRDRDDVIRALTDDEGKKS